MLFRRTGSWILRRPSFLMKGRGQLPAVQNSDLQENTHLNFSPPLKFLLLKWGLLMIIVWIKQAMVFQELRKLNHCSCYWVTLKRAAGLIWSAKNMFDVLFKKINRLGGFQAFPEVWTTTLRILLIAITHLRYLQHTGSLPKISKDSVCQEEINLVSFACFSFSGTSFFR